MALEKLINMTQKTVGFATAQYSAKRSFSMQLFTLGFHQKSSASCLTSISPSRLIARKRLA